MRTKASTTTVRRVRKVLRSVQSCSLQRDVPCQHTASQNSKIPKFQNSSTSLARHESMTLETVGRGLYSPLSCVTRCMSEIAHSPNHTSCTKTKRCRVHSARGRRKHEGLHADNGNHRSRDAQILWINFVHSTFRPAECSIEVIGIVDDAGWDRMRGEKQCSNQFSEVLGGFEI